jgi:hypothetical protein
VKKAVIKSDCSPSRIVVVGDLPPKFEPEKFQASFSETPTSISIAIPLRGFDPSELKIRVGELWVDVYSEDPMRKLNLSHELFERVLPASAACESTPDSIIVTVEKQVEGLWGSVIQRDDVESSISSNFQDLLSKLETDPELTDEGASGRFEQAVNLAKEEGTDISSWFVDP